jgi:hypothetical protein
MDGISATMDLPGIPLLLSLHHRQCALVADTYKEAGFGDATWGADYVEHPHDAHAWVDSFDESQRAEHIQEPRPLADG